MKNTVVYLLCILFIISTLGCGSKNRCTVPAQDSDKSDSESQSLVSNPAPIFSDFSESVMNDIRIKFENSEMILTGLQRDSKGEKVRAVIETGDSQVSVPKAIELLAMNFGSVKQITVIIEDDEFSLSMEKYHDITNSEPEDIYQKIWMELSDSEQIADGISETSSV